MNKRTKKIVNETNAKKKRGSVAVALGLLSFTMACSFAFAIGGVKGKGDLSNLASATTEYGTGQNVDSYTPRAVSDGLIVDVSASLAVYPNTDLEDLRGYIKVWYYEEGSSTPIPTNDYTITGTLKVGNCVLTISSHGFSKNIYITVLPAGVTSISAQYAGNSVTVYSTTPLDDLRENLTVHAYSTDGVDGATILDNSDYRLSGDLSDIDSDHTATVTVTYVHDPKITCTFKVNVQSTGSGSDEDPVKPIVITNIEPNFNQGANLIYTSDALSVLNQYLKVMVTTSDGNTKQVYEASYTLSGKLVAGNSVITLTYNGVSTTFTVNVTQSKVTGIKPVFTQGDNKYYASTPLDDLKSVLSVYPEYNSGEVDYDNPIPADQYSLTGDLSVIENGFAEVTVNYNGLTAKFKVYMGASSVSVESITASYAGGQQNFVIYTTSSLDTLKGYLNVIAHLSNGVEEVLEDDAYTLSGKLVAGTSYITVNYGGATCTISVKVTDVSVTRVTATINANAPKFYSTTPVEDLRQFMTVTAYYSDGTPEVVTDYEIKGTLAKPDGVEHDDGSRTLTIIYKGVSGTVNVNVSVTQSKPVSVVSISATLAEGYTYYSSDSIEVLREKGRMTVTATLSDGTVNEIVNYVLSGSFSDGLGSDNRATITLTYGEISTTVSVNVTPVTLTGITIELNEGAELFSNLTYADLRKAITVTKYYTQNRTVIVTDYTIVLDRVTVTDETAKLPAGVHTVSIVKSEGVSYTPLTINVTKYKAVKIDVANKDSVEVFEAEEGEKFNAAINRLKALLNVRVTYSDGTEGVLLSAPAVTGDPCYTLSVTDSDGGAATSFVKDGVYTITVTHSQDGSLTASFNVTVKGNSTATDPEHPGVEFKLDRLVVNLKEGAVIHAWDSLDDVKNKFIVNAVYAAEGYDDYYVNDVQDFTVNGDIANPKLMPNGEIGTEITVFYKEASFTMFVAVEEKKVSRLEVSGLNDMQQAGIKIYGNTSPELLRNYLTVTVHYNDGTQKTLGRDEYGIGGTFSSVNADKQATITISYIEHGETYREYIHIAVTTTGDQEVTLLRLEVTFASGDASNPTVIYTSNTLDDLRNYLTVIAVNSDGTTNIVTGYTISGTLNKGQSWLTVNYGGLSQAFEVTVTEVKFDHINVGFIKSGNIYGVTPLDDLKGMLSVVAVNNDGSTYEVSAEDYQLTGTLDSISNTITVHYNGATATFEVTVETAVDPSNPGKPVIVKLVSISAEVNQGSKKIYTTTPIEELAGILTVRATTEYTYPGSDKKKTEETVVTDYKLSGELTVGTSLITVYYNGKTASFKVTVSDASLTGLVATFNQGGTKIYTSTPLDDLRNLLVVTLNYADGTSAQTNEYKISGSLSKLENGYATLSITYNYDADIYSTIRVKVETDGDPENPKPVVLTGVSVDETNPVNPEKVIYPGTSLESLKGLITVRAHFSTDAAGDKGTIITDYTLSGELVAGTSVITVTYNGKTATFEVFVTAVAPVSISATINQGYSKVYASTPLSDLKKFITVNVVNNDGSSAVVTDYILSTATGDLSDVHNGYATVTVTYGSLDPVEVEVKIEMYTPAPTPEEPNPEPLPVSIVSLTAEIATDAAGNPVPYNLYPSSTYEDVKGVIKVTALRSDNVSEVITDYTITGAIEIGTSRLTAHYGGKSATFSVDVKSVDIASVSAVYTQNVKVYATSSVESLKDSLVVTVIYTDGTTETVSADRYTLTGYLAQLDSNGYATITVNYDNFKSSFKVKVESTPGTNPGDPANPLTITNLKVDFAQDTDSSIKIYPNTTLDQLRAYITVTVVRSDGSEEVTSAYSLSGTLSVGKSQITVTYNNRTAAFMANVSAREVDYIQATYKQPGKVFVNTPLLDLKNGLTVTAFYKDGSKEVVTDYSLSGDLSKSQSVTVTYQGKTATFEVVLESSSVEPGDPVTVTELTVNYEQRFNIYPAHSLDYIYTAGNLTVTAYLSNGTSEALRSQAYTLTCTDAEGNAVTDKFGKAGTYTFTVSYCGFSETFTVTVTENSTPDPDNPDKPVTLLSVTADLDGETLYDYNTVKDLKEHLTVTAIYVDGTFLVLGADDYTLSANDETVLTDGMQITVSYEGLEATVDVEVTANVVEDFSLNLGGTEDNPLILASGTTFETLRSWIVVTELYTDGTEKTWTYGTDNRYEIICDPDPSNEGGVLILADVFEIQVKNLDNSALIKVFHVSIPKEITIPGVNDDKPVTVTDVVLEEVTYTLKESITVFEGEDVSRIYDNLVVSATYKYYYTYTPDGATEAVTGEYEKTETVEGFTVDYGEALKDGELVAGDYSFPVIYNGVEATQKLNVSVLKVAALAITDGDIAFSQGVTKIYANTDVNTLKHLFTITVRYNNGTTRVLEESEYEITAHDFSNAIGSMTVTVTSGEAGVSGSKTVSVNVEVSEETPVTLVGITAVYTPGSEAVYPSTSIETLRGNLKVYAHLSNEPAGSEGTQVTEYTLSGTLSVGTPRITVTYQGKTDYFFVTVSEVGLAQGNELTVSFEQGYNKIYAATPLSELKSMLTVKANLADGTSFEVAANEYVLDGDLSETTDGYATVTVKYTSAKYGSAEATFAVKVEIVNQPKVLDYLTVQPTATATIYSDMTVEEIVAASALNVVAHFTDGTTENVAIESCTLSEMSEIVGGRASVTLTYLGKTAVYSFNVTVVTAQSVTAEFNDDPQPTVYANTPVNDIKSLITVTMTDSRGNEHVLEADEYTLSGSLATVTDGKATLIVALVSDKNVKCNLRVAIYANPENPEVPVTLTGISASYTQGITKIYTGITLEQLLVNIGDDITVNAQFSDGTNSDVKGYTVTCDEIGEDGKFATAGTYTLDVYYNGKTASFNITVEDAAVLSITAEIKDGAQIFINTPEAVLKQQLIVTVSYVDGRTPVVLTPDADFTAEINVNELNSKKATITVTYEGKSCTTAEFNLATVPTDPSNPIGKELNSISASYTANAGAEFYTANTKEYVLENGTLTVTAYYNDGSDAAVEATLYTVDGDLANPVDGKATLTVTYLGKTATFTVDVKTTVELPDGGGEVPVGEFELEATFDGATLYANATLNEIKEHITVNAVYKHDGSTVKTVSVAADDFTIEDANIIAGVNTLTVNALNKTTTVDVNIANAIVSNIKVNLTTVKVLKGAANNTVLDNLVVTALLSDGTEQVIEKSDYTLTCNKDYSAGFAEAGNYVFTVEYSGKTADFTVNVIDNSGTITVPGDGDPSNPTPTPGGDTEIDMSKVESITLDSIKVHYDQKGALYEIDGLDKFKSNGTLSVYGAYTYKFNDGTPDAHTLEAVDEADYTLELAGTTLKDGVVVSHNGKTVTVTPTITDKAVVPPETDPDNPNHNPDPDNPTKYGITAVFADGKTYITLPANTTLDQIKALLTVKLYFNDGEEEVTEDYTLSIAGGATSLTVGNNTILVKYNGNENVYVSITVTVDKVTEDLPATVESISVSYVGSVAIYDSYTLDDVKASGALSVIATLKVDGTDVTYTKAITDYILTADGYLKDDGTLKSGTVTFKVSYVGDDKTVDIVVIARVVSGIEVTNNQTANDKIYGNTPLDDVKKLITVIPVYNDGTRGEALAADGYTLTGELTNEHSMLTVTYTVDDKKFTQTVIIDVDFSDEPIVVEIVSLTAKLIDGAGVVYEGDSLDSLKGKLEVEVKRNDGTTDIVSDYTLSGTLTVGTCTVTVNYGGKSTYVTVEVQAVRVVSISAQYTPTDVVYGNTPLDDLRSSLVVTAYYNNNTTKVLDSNSYSLSLEGDLTKLENGFATIKVKYNVDPDIAETTFQVFVSTLPGDPDTAIEIVNITAEYVQTGAVYVTSDIEDLKPNLTVTATYNYNGDDGNPASERVYTYTLTGELKVGISVITVTYNGKSATFKVSVSELEVTGISANYAKKTNVYGNTPLDELKANLTVTATYADGKSAEVTEYSLSGNLSDIDKNGMATITVTYKGFTATFKVQVETQPDPENPGDKLPVLLSGIEASIAKNNGQEVDYTLYATSSLDELRSFIEVYAKYTDGTSSPLENYELSGVLEAGKISSIKVTYNGFVASVEVRVSEAALTSITANFNQGYTKVYASTAPASLSKLLTVTAYYSDKTYKEVTDYSITGSLDVTVNGYATMYVQYGGLEPVPFKVKVEMQDSTPQVLDHIAVVNYTPVTLYPAYDVDRVKEGLEVWAYYTDGTSRALAADEYQLIGNLANTANGQTSVTVYYLGATTSLTVTVNTSSQAVTAFTANYDGTVIYTSAPGSYNLDDLKEHLTVLVTYGTEEPIQLAADKYTLTGTLAQGKNTITVNFSGKTATFEVTVEEVKFNGSIATDNDSIKVSDGTTLGDIKDRVNVYAVNNDGTRTLITSDLTFTCAGLTDASVFEKDTVYTVVITYTLDGVEYTCNLTVEVLTVPGEPVTVTSITASYAQGTTKIYPDSLVDAIRPGLTVTANLSDGTSENVTEGYTLTGSFKNAVDGVAKVTVSYGGETATVDVNVTTSYNEDGEDKPLEIASLKVELASGYTYHTTDSKEVLKDYLTVSVVYNSGEEVVVEDYEYSVAPAADYKFTVSVVYDGHNGSVEGTYSAKELTHIGLNVAGTADKPLLINDSEDLEPYIKSITKVTAYYSDGTSADITADDLTFTFGEPVTDENGKLIKVTVEYSGKTAEFYAFVPAKITVDPTPDNPNPSPEEVDRIELTGITVNGEQTVELGADFTLAAVQTYIEKGYITLDVKAVYDVYKDGEKVGTHTEEITGYELAVNGNKLTVTFMGETGEFGLKIAQPDSGKPGETPEVENVVGISAKWSDGAPAEFYATVTADELKNYIEVTAYMSNGTERMLGDGEYALVLNVAGGKFAVTIYVNDLTANLQAGITAKPSEPLTLKDISVELDNSKHVYVGGTAEDLRGLLTVTLTYSNGTTEVVEDYVIKAANGSMLPATFTEGELSFMVVSANGEKASGPLTVNVLDVEKLEITGIRASFVQDGKVYGNTPLKDLSTLTVYATYSDGVERVLEPDEYTFEGTLNAAVSVITVVVTQGDDEFRDSFTVTVEMTTDVPVSITNLEAKIVDNKTSIYTTSKLEDVRGIITVTAYLSNGESIDVSDYEISGELVAGTSVITVTYGGLSASVAIDVKDANIVAIYAEFSQVGDIYANTSLDELRSGLTVTAALSGNSTRVLDSHEYTLSGDLTQLTNGVAVVTVTLNIDNSKQATFNVSVVTGLTDPDDPASPIITVSLNSINAVFSQGEDKIYTSTSIDDLRAYLTVTANMSNGESKEVDNYVIQGSLNVGTSVLTVSYSGKTATFEVVVSEVALQPVPDPDNPDAPDSAITVLFIQGSTKIYASTPLDDLRTLLTVIAHFNDGSTAVVTDYQLSGDITDVVTVTYQGHTATFTVKIDEEVVIDSVNAEVKGTTAIYPTSKLDDVRNVLVVTVNYRNNITGEVTSSETLDYTLSGTLSAGTSWLTVSYNGISTTVAVKVLAVEISRIDVKFAQSGKVYESTHLSDLKSMFKVTAVYTDGSTEAIENFTLSGKLEAGKTCKLTLTYNNTTVGEYAVYVEAVKIVSVTAQLNQTENDKVYEGETLDSIRRLIIVTVAYSNGVEEQISGYSLEGEIVAGVSHLTVTYGGMSDTVAVTVGKVELESLSVIFTQGSTKIYAETPLDDLKPMLDVVAVYNNGNRVTLKADEYLLTRDASDLETVTVVYGGKTQAFKISIEKASTGDPDNPDVPVAITGITAEFNQQGLIYAGSSLELLRGYLKVTAHFSGAADEVVTGYTLSGELKDSVSIITVSYNGKTANISVNVTGITVDEITANFNQTAKVYSTTGLSALRNMLVVTVKYTDGSIAATEDYTLSGDLSSLDKNGYATVTVTAIGSDKTAAFKVYVESTPAQNPDEPAIPVVIDRITVDVAEDIITLYPSMSIEVLRGYITVKAYTDGGECTVVNDYTLTGTLNVESPTTNITVHYQGKEASFTVNVVPATLTGIVADFNQSYNKVYTSTNLLDLKDMLVVTAKYDDGTERILEAGEYGLTGSLASPVNGVAEITVSYGGKEDKFNVTVETAVILTSITAELAESLPTFYAGTDIEALRGYITVKAFYNNNTAAAGEIITKYSLTAGKLIAGNNTIEVSYNGQTAILNVTAEKVTVTGISAVFTQNRDVYESTALEDLKDMLVVTVNYNDGTSSVLSAEDYGLEKDAAKDNTIIVTYRTFTDSFTVSYAQLPLQPVSITSGSGRNCYLSYNFFRRL